MKKLMRLAALMMALLMMTTCAGAEESLLPALPNIPAAAPERLAEALNAEGGNLVFANPADAAIWPMIPAEEEGMLCLMSTNAGVDASASAVYTTVTAQAGDALAITFKTSTELGADFLQLCINGEPVKVFAGERAWTRYAHTFPEAGTYEVALLYVKDEVLGEGADVVYIDTVEHLTGAAAQAAVAANAAYPEGTVNTLTVTNTDARMIHLDDPTFALVWLFGLADFYIVPGGEAQVLATLEKGVDPDGAWAVISADGGRNIRLTDHVEADGYTFPVPIGDADNTIYTSVTLHPAADAQPTDARCVVCFDSEAAADAFIQLMGVMGYDVKGWSYADGEQTRSQYTLTFIDQHGEFQEGVKVTIIAPGYFEIATSGADGMVTFAAPSQAYEVHVIDVPEGYSFDSNRSWRLDAAGGEFIVDIERVNDPVI